MRSIAIVLGDNDFGSTFNPLLESIYNLLIYRSGKCTEEEIKIAINEGIRYHFVAFDLCSRIHTTTEKEIESTVKYLKEGITILFDEDAEQDWMVNYHDSGAWYLDISSGQVDWY